MMNLHEAIGNDPLSASLLWSGAGACRFAVAPTLRQPRLSRQQWPRASFSFQALLESARLYGGEDHGILLTFGNRGTGSFWVLKKRP